MWEEAKDCSEVCLRCNDITLSSLLMCVVGKLSL